MSRADHTRPHAVFAVSDKTGITDLGLALDRLGWRIVATTGTAALLAEHRVQATTVSSFTGMPELFGGRVKTFHPTIFGGILGWPDEEGSSDAPAAAAAGGESGQAGVPTPIALVVGNFYPLDGRLGETADDAVLDSVDIGGPAMIAAAAKNHLRAIPLVSPAQYGEFLRLLDAAGGDPRDIAPVARRAYASRAMDTVSSYYREVAELLR